MRKLMLTTCTAAVLAIAVGGGPAFAQAPAAPLPTGDAVLAKYVEATGGAAAYDAIKNRVVHARMEILGAGVVLGLTVYNAPPANLYTVVESEATGRIETGVSDGVAWENSPRCAAPSSRTASSATTRFGTRSSTGLRIGRST